MIVELTSAQSAELERLAADANRTPEAIAQEAVSSYLHHLESLTKAIREGEESAERDGWLTTEEVFERLNKKLLRTA